MKRKSLLVLAALAAIFASCEKPSGPVRVAETLTFEENNLSSLIDNPQYGGALLYSEADYSWTAGRISHKNIKADWSSYGMGWGWDSGAAVSNYVMTGYGDYTTQLAVKTDAKNGGHNGSSNFIVWYGHDYGYNTLPEFTVTGNDVILKEVYVNNTAYGLSNCYDKDGKCTILDSQEVYVELTATTVSGAKVSSKFYLVKGSNIVTDWTKWDLSSLGEESIKSFTLNVDGNIANDWGFSFPAYCALDDLTYTYLELAE